MIKVKHKPLIIEDILAGKLTIVDSFLSPDAFIFIYELNLFVSLNNGKIQIYNINGHMITE